MYQLIAQKNYTKYVKMGLSYCKHFALPELQASQKDCIQVYVDRPKAQLWEQKKKRYKVKGKGR